MTGHYDYCNIPLSPRLIRIKNSLEPYSIEKSFTFLGIRPVKSQMRHEFKERFRCDEKMQLQNKQRKIQQKIINRQSLGQSRTMTPAYSPNPTQYRPNTVDLDLNVTLNLPELSYNRPIFSQRRLQRKKNGLAIFTKLSQSFHIPSSIIDRKRSITPNQINKMNELSENPQLKCFNQTDFQYKQYEGIVKIKHLIKHKRQIKEPSNQIFKTVDQYETKRPTQPPKKVIEVFKSSKLFKTNRNNRHVVNYKKHNKSLTETETSPNVIRKRMFQLNDLWSDNFLSQQY